MSNHVLRIHPAIGFARVGNSEEFYLGQKPLQVCRRMMQKV